MFDMNKIGKTIKNARNAKNMTQMDLADAMGISYQAVSNWERGNSMPDISKLPELCDILGLNLDELMGTNNNSHTVQVVKKLVDDENADITLEELADVAPIIPPKKVQKVVVHCNNTDTSTGIDMKTLLSLAPFLDDEYLNDIAEKISLNGLSELTGLAPFLEEETLSKIIFRHLENHSSSIDDVTSLAPFLDEDTLDKLVDSCLATENCEVSKLIGLCPFLDEMTVRKIADYVMGQKNYGVLSQIAPFM
mgnify:CR=1 FL=1